MNRQKFVSTALTIKISGAYTANDVVGGLITINVANAGGGGIIRWAALVDDDNEKAAMSLYLFNSSPTAFLDDAAFAPVVADLKKMIGKISFAVAGYETINGNAINIVRGTDGSGIDLNNDFTTSDGNLYAYLVCVATPTYTAVTDLTLLLGLWLDG